MAERALYFEHEVRYTNAAALPVRDVVDSLLALERMTRRFLPRTLNALAEVEIADAELLVVGFDQGSFVEHVLVRLGFGSEERFDAFLDKVRQGRFGDALKDAWQDLPEGKRMKSLAISVVIAALLGAGVTYVLKDPPREVTNVIIIGAESYQRSPEAFEGIVQAAVGHDRKALAQDAARIIAPAKADPAGTVVMNNDPRLSIARPVVEAMPNEYDPAPAESVVDYQNVVVDIRATDRDSTTTGWWAIVPSLFKKRVRMELAEGVKASALARHASVHADVTLVSAPGARGKLEPKRIILSRVLPTRRRASAR